MTNPEEGGLVMSHRTHICLTAVTLVVLLVAACTLGIVLSQRDTKPSAINQDPPSKPKPGNNGKPYAFHQGMEVNEMLGSNMLNWNVVDNMDNKINESLVVQETGVYFVHLQVSFSGKNCSELNVFLDVKYTERTENYTASYGKRCPTREKEKWLQSISHTILIRLAEGNQIIVRAEPYHLVLFQSYPKTTFLTAFKYSD
ncbi:lymphotoxin-alpha-like [Polyodon spathula]|uniref:lymphotoxin-alpha-like n=1 Tax=Polyodon spathula TaxID=7913 RepID=UPI001B7E1BF3|nr:lymphotoxin-alpha-like [Polyodon spathula]